LIKEKAAPRRGKFEAALLERLKNLFNRKFMRKASKSQVQPSAFAGNNLPKFKNPPPPPDPPESPHNYIVIRPTLFNDLIRTNEKFAFIGDAELRNPKFNYKKSAEDQWTHKSDFAAELWIDFDVTSEFLLYVDFQGRLYSCQTILEAAEIIKELEQQEALKIIP
jgi:hypothetical protein